LNWVIALYSPAVWSALLIREARLRAGLTQQELADRSGRKRSVIARWERGAIEPSLETFLEIIGVCGFELPLELMPRDHSAFERVQKNALLSPERRVQRLLRASPSDNPFDPYALIAALERRQASYVVVGAFGRIIQGADETTTGLDIAPSLRSQNLRRLALTLDDLAAAGTDGQRIALDESNVRQAPTLELHTPKGKLTIVPEPAGTRGGYDDLRRAATHEPIGRGLRVAVASTADLARMLAALGRDEDMPKLIALRRLQTLERKVGHELAL
jgi:transcriptional regulator with XRE-family HTH domain